MPYRTVLAISATIVALVISACGGPSRSSTASTVPATSATAANPVQRENSLPGTPGWEIPASAGTVITGFASETSVASGQSFDLHVSSPPGSRYRVLVYRLGWYQGIGGRLIMCVPGCHSSQAAIAQPPPTTPNSVTGLFRASWRVTDRLEIPSDAVSGYYEAKLEIVSGAHAGAVGSVPLIVRQSPGAAPSAVLVQVPVNTWEAYNPWGGKSLYQFNTRHHAVEVSFDRPYDQQMFDNMVTKLELPWVRFLERSGIDVSYQADVDTDEDPGSLLHHRLVFSIGHDEYWTQPMRDAFNRALALSTNLMFGSDSADWRMRYAASRRTMVEWRDPSVDPVRNRRLDNGFFSTFGEPECQLMGVQHQWAAQRDLTRPPTAYTVVGPASDPWLAAARLDARRCDPGGRRLRVGLVGPQLLSGPGGAADDHAPPGIERRHSQRKHGPRDRAKRRPRVRDGHDGTGVGARRPGRALPQSATGRLRQSSPPRSDSSRSRALAGRAAREVKLVGDVDQLTRGQLPAADGQPAVQVRRFHPVLATPQRVLDRAKDGAQEVSLIARVVPIRARRLRPSPTTLPPARAPPRPADSGTGGGPFGFQAGRP